ncbi:hypothetical protein LBMAG43_17380 [Methylococcaceae bacterium]|nr:hypothetical protein LBMAG43_17380 [Methylococcaceae bacterium]
MTTIKNRLEKLELLAQPPKNDLIIRINLAGVDVAPIGYRDNKTGIIYGVDDDLNHLEGFNILFAEYPEGLGVGF